MAAQGCPVAVTCRVVGMSRSGFYDRVGRVPSARTARDAQMLELVQWSHERSLGTYGAPRIHADLTMERGVSCGTKRVARLMRNAGIGGVCHQRKRRGWKPLPAPHDDLVKRQFSAHAPNRVWFCDITQHRARDGWAYCVAVIDTWSWDGRLVTICAPNSSLTPWKCCGGNENQLPGPSSTPTEERKVDSTGRRNTLTSEVFKDGDGRLE